MPGCGLCAVNEFQVGLPGAVNAVSIGSAGDGLSFSVTIEYGGTTCVSAIPSCAVVIEVASSP